MLHLPRTRALLRETLSRVSAELRPRLIGALKVSAYFALVSLCALVFSVRAARGALGEVSLSTVRQLSDVSDLFDSTKFLELNGQRFGVSTTVVPGPPEAVLDRFAEACRKHPGELARVAAAQGLTGIKGASGGSGREPIVRNQDENDGMVGCLVQSPAAAAVSLPEAIQEFVRTRDASVFGDFLVVYAKRQTNGKSHVVAVWTHGSFKVLDMFPAQGDAPGSDSTLAGRPRNARRVLSGAAADEPYGMRIYETPGEPKQALSSFEEDLRARGWARLGEPPPDGSPSVALRHASGVLAILAANSSGGGKTAVVLMEMGRGKPARKVVP